VTFTEDLSGVLNHSNGDGSEGVQPTLEIWYIKIYISEPEHSVAQKCILIALHQTFHQKKKLVSKAMFSDWNIHICEIFISSRYWPRHRNGALVQILSTVLFPTNCW
jgi:hypothetical protein